MAPRQLLQLVARSPRQQAHQRVFQERLLGGDGALEVARVHVEAVLVAEHLAGVGIGLHDSRLQRVEGLLAKHALQGGRCEIGIKYARRGAEAVGAGTALPRCAALLN